MPRIFAALLLLSTAVSAAQRPADTRAQAETLRGRVVAASNDAALRRVRVAVAMGAERIEPVLTDDDGRFALRLPLRAAVTLTTTKAGYAATTLAVPANAFDREVNLRLARGAAISGRIVDASGTPAADVPVAVRRIGGVAGGPQHVTTTDDLGEYRLGGLAAGRYLLLSGLVPQVVMIAGAPTSAPIIVQVASGPAPASRTLLESDQTLDVTAGEDVTAADLRLPTQPTLADQRAELLALGIPPAAACPGTAAVRIRVTTDGGEPLAGVAVSLTSRAAMVSRGNERTDSNGMTVFECLTASTARIEVSKRGYVAERFGDRRTRSMNVTVRDRQVTDAPTIVMRRTAAAVGTVTDEHGEPMEGVTVRVLAARYANGRTRALPAGVARPTDDRGRFRVYGLEPGDYLLAASVDAVPSGSAEAASAYVPSYFPGTPDIGSAEHVRIGAGDLTGLNLLFTPSPAARVSGIALDSEGNPVRGRVQLLVSKGSGAVSGEPMQAPTSDAGEFVLSNVPPGEYVLHAIRPAGLGLRPEIGSALVSITRGSPPPVTIRTSSGVTLAGRIVLEDAERRALTGVSLTAFPVDFDRVPVPADGKGIVRMGDGAFYFTSLHGATRIAMTVGPDDWYLKSVRVGGIDVTDAAVDAAADVDDAEIVISTAGASITGRTTDAARTDDYAVVVFPADRSLWAAHSRHLKLTSSSADGTFRVNGLPPGTYWAAALEPGDVQIDNGGWEDPALLDRLSPLASRVTLREGERRTVTLRVVR